MTRTRVVAHRGSSDRHPDNSWTAFHAAVTEGADAIECDVVRTRDGVLVVRHDLVVAGAPVDTLDVVAVVAAEPQTMRFFELADWAARTRIDLLVEVKDPAAMRDVGAAVDKSAWRDHIVIAGFHGPALAALKQSHPHLRTSFMMGSVVAVGDLVRLARACRADGVHPCWDGRSPHPHRLIDAAFVERLHREDLALTLWHEEREDELRALVALGPDAICTNTPAALRAIIDAQAGIRTSVPEESP